MPYLPRFTRRFKKAYRKKSTEHKGQVDKTLRLLLRDPKYPGLQTHKVRGTGGVWEGYINAGMRITFEYSEEEGGAYILLRNNCLHDTVLENP